jgi:hypothetical protein
VTGPAKGKADGKRRVRTNAKAIERSRLPKLPAPNERVRAFAEHVIQFAG